MIKSWNCQFVRFNHSCIVAVLRPEAVWNIPGDRIWTKITLTARFISFPYHLIIIIIIILTPPPPPKKKKKKRKEKKEYSQNILKMESTIYTFILAYTCLDIPLHIILGSTLLFTDNVPLILFVTVCHYHLADKTTQIPRNLKLPCVNGWMLSGRTHCARTGTCPMLAVSS